MSGSEYISVEVDTSQVNDLLRKLSRSLDDKTVKAVVKDSAQIYMDRAALTAPEAKRPVKRYSDGKVIATYHPGNLGRSIKILPARKIKAGVLVGPKRSRSPKGNFKGSKVDGYYAHFIEGGTKDIKPKPFIDKAWQDTREIVYADIIRGLQSTMTRAGV